MPEKPKTQSIPPTPRLTTLAVAQKLATSLYHRRGPVQVPSPKPITGVFEPPVIPTQLCPACGQLMLAEESTCPHCWARIITVMEGYCRSCRSMVQVRDDDLCSICGREVYDPHPVKRAETGENQLGFQEN
jgi:RNA polymerase subunit RPABC4/transcription elongation factor Spt4